MPRMPEFGSQVKRVCLLVTVLLSGCCTPQPARLDPKKVAAFRDEIATVVSYALLYGLPAKDAAHVNADAEFMLR